MSSIPRFLTRTGPLRTTLARASAWDAGVPSGIPSDAPARVVFARTAGVPVHAVTAPTAAEGLRFLLRFLEARPQNPILLTFANPATAKLVRRHAGFRGDLDAFDLVLPDGIGMCMAMRLLHGVRAQRISFDMTSLAPMILEEAQRRGLTVGLAGGDPGIAERARDRLRERFPSLRIVGAADGFGDMAAKAAQVASMQPDIIVCGMGAVRQEAFLLQVAAQGWRGWGFTCGGFLDQLQQGAEYYPAWVDRANLRWAYRLAREPRRLWRRYVLDYGLFGLMLCAALARGTQNARPNP